MKEQIEKNQEIEVLFEDDHYISVNKPSGLLVHAYKESTDTTNLMQKLRAQCGKYLYPLHRIDRPVSGIVTFAFSSEAASKLKEIWHTKKVVKEYLALVKGKIDEPGTFNFDLTNDNKVKQSAITHYKVEQGFGEWNTLVRVSIETGRKHQIRRHFSRRCHQIVGDTAHGKGKLNRLFREHYDFHRIFLHSEFFKFHHPFKDELIEISCPLPTDLQKVLAQVDKNLAEFNKN